MHEIPTNTTRNATGSGDFNEQTPVSAIVEFVDEIKEHPTGRGVDLVPLLSEGHPLYSERPANEVVKLRAYAMATLERTGLPDDAMPYVRESLESSFNPYSVAAAARAIRGTRHPEPELLELLLKSMFHVWQSDRPINFTSYRVEWPQINFSTSVTEIFQTLAHFGNDARDLLPALRLLASDPNKFSDATYACLTSCIAAIHQQSGNNSLDEKDFTVSTVQEHTQHHSTVKHWPPWNLSLEDQDGAKLRWGEFFGHKPSVIGFFYTRCGNPNKCTRTIFNLARIQEEVERRGLTGRVRVSAVSYDVQFDTPAALRSYGDARNFHFNNDYRMFRVSSGFEQLVEQMELEVSFVGKQVSSHRIELFVLDRSGEIVQSFVRLQSEPEIVADALASLI
ncbi:MAG: SCO family protein [Pseudomonadota bacterium]